MGQLAPSPEDKAAAEPKQEPLLSKVMADLPRYGENPTPAAIPQPIGEVTSETTRLAPLVVVGSKRVKLADFELLTRKAFAAEIFKRYDYSAFSLFQHREDVRLQEMADLKNYVDNLLLAGDVGESRAIRKESSRLFLRTPDPETEYIDRTLNPRVR